MTRIVAAALLAVLTIASGSRAADAPKVLVAPFTEISDGPKREWISRAIQQALVAELARVPLVSPMNAKVEVKADDAQAAAAAAKDAGAAFAVFGAYQLVEQELRVTGQVLDAGSGAVLGGIKATGNLRDLFGVEDIVAAQVKRALTSKLAPTTQPAEPLAERTTIEPSGPVRAEREQRRTFDGSDLEQSLGDDRPYAAAPPRVYDDERERYRYGVPYAPYGWSPYGYGYGHPYGYGVPYTTYRPGYVYSPNVVYIGPRPSVRVRIPVYREPVVPNGNYNRGP